MKYLINKIIFLNQHFPGKIYIKVNKKFIKKINNKIKNLKFQALLH